MSGGNVLTRKTLLIIREAAGGFNGPLPVYGEASSLGAESPRRSGSTSSRCPLT